MPQAHPDSFHNRHLGPRGQQIDKMLDTIGLGDIDSLIDQTVPQSIRLSKDMELPAPLSESEYLQHMRELASQNQVNKSYIGLGYHPCIVPAVIRRNVLENPGWYTQYTPYQAEIAQGRLEGLLNFQTTISDLCGLPIANASLLDESTAAAEAMIMLFHAANKRKVEKPVFWVSDQVLPQTKDLLITKAEPLGIEVQIAAIADFVLDERSFGILLQYPGQDGLLEDPSSLIEYAKEKGIKVAMCCDLLALTLLKSPGDLGADIAVGSAQRFGIPMGYGGPHAAFFACVETYKRQIPGRIIGVSVDKQGNPALRMALQTREQHIRREKATSNICTAQALLAIMSGFYALYHGPEGLKAIAQRIHDQASSLAASLKKLGFDVRHQQFFDAIRIGPGDLHDLAKVRQVAEQKQINLRYFDDGDVGINLHEACTDGNLQDLLSVFAEVVGKEQTIDTNYNSEITPGLKRSSEYLTHPVFHQHRSESEMMRYMKRLENKDLSLTQSMIALGSCTMKLNAAAELEPLSWPEFAQMHPFAPITQAAGYQVMIKELEEMLCEVTGFTACSLQPNSGAQGEYTGLMVIRAWQLDRGEDQRNTVLIPASAHGTNPASAVMAGMRVVVVQCDEMGNIELEDLKAKADEHADTLAGLMVTYPSTHGVFEEAIREICDKVHECGGLVYMDGANMNAQVGLTSPAQIGADVCHLNLHKTFAIPHGGGGPGMGPICVNDKLAPFLPGHPLSETGGEKAIGPVSAAAWGSASILLISYGYLRMLGTYGSKRASELAILNANYMKTRLEKEFDVLFTGKSGRVAHEFIIDIRPFKQETGIDVEDIAKRLMDYGFHAPTVSFPVAGTMMIEPTESESLEELDRFVDALLSIREEIRQVAQGNWDAQNNPLKNAPHTAEVLSVEDWDKPYTRKQAIFPLDWVAQTKFWPSVSRIDNPYGDRNLICTCPPLEAYEAEETVA